MNAGPARTDNKSDADIAAIVQSHIRTIDDFPRPGVSFKDLTPLFADGPAFRAVIDGIVEHFGDGEKPAFDVVVGIEARGFVLAAAVAYATGAGLVPVRKAGKLPGATYSTAYALEYGDATLEIHIDAFTPGARVLVLDDVLATGGTADATLSLVEQAGGAVIGFAVLLELEFLGGRERLEGRPLHAVLSV